MTGDLRYGEQTRRFGKIVNAIRTIKEYQIVLRAFEGILFLGFALVCLGSSWLVRHDPVF